MHKKQEIKWLLQEGSPGCTSAEGLVRHGFKRPLALSEGK